MNYIELTKTIQNNMKAWDEYSLEINNLFNGFTGNLLTQLNPDLIIPELVHVTQPPDYDLTNKCYVAAINLSLPGLTVIEALMIRLRVDPDSKWRQLRLPDDSDWRDANSANSVTACAAAFLQQIASRYPSDVIGNPSQNWWSSRADHR